MTMAWTAQTGLGPRTVILSLKVFIVLIFYAHERNGICTAQRIGLPKPLMDNIQQMRNYFCTAGNQPCDRSNGNCGNQLNTLCEQICRNQCPYNCWNNTARDTTIPPHCRGSQIQYCVYMDAVACYEDDDRAVCVHRSGPGSTSTFCVCRSDQDMTYTSCKPPSDNSGNNTAAVVLGSLFALLLFLVIIGAVIFYLRRQGRLPSFVKQTSNPAGLPSVPLEARDASRSKLPDPPVPGGSMEYSYAYDHRPAKPGAKEDPDQDDHTYYSVGEGGYREGNRRYVLDGQRKIPATKKPDTSTDDAKDHPCFVLNRNDDSDESGSERGERHENGDEVTDSSTGVKPREGTDDYTSLVPTGDPKSRSKQPGKEDYVSPTLANESDVRSPPVESPTDVDDDSYFPLIQAAAPKSTVKQSGYEDAKIPTSTSPSEVQPSNCDDDTYTPLALTVEPKSQNEHSGYEAATILKPGSAAITDDMSPYDHLHRQEENESREGALSTVDVDDYQHLVNN
ncbi:uncharacterized protein [Asterias amurensis]|uniref:uncharacterized protein n=1 Tax=Asterias amurensis TaxID=7602 RepID=UPI003AB19A97